MKTYNYSDLSKTDIQKLVQRNVDPADEIRRVVEDIIDNVRKNGDAALIDYASKFDKVELKSIIAGKAAIADIAHPPWQLNRSRHSIPPTTI